VSAAPHLDSERFRLPIEPQRCLVGVGSHCRAEPSAGGDGFRFYSEPQSWPRLERVAGISCLNITLRLWRRSSRSKPRLSDYDPGCVKTHTSAKRRKHNSPARHRTWRVQYDLTLRDAIHQKYFYVWRERWSFRTAKTQSGHEWAAFAAMQRP